MNHSEFEHIVRAASSVTKEKEFIVIGSQSVLGKLPDAPRTLRQSVELDLYPKHRPDLAILIATAGQEQKALLTQRWKMIQTRKQVKTQERLQEIRNKIRQKHPG
ncbi:MAG: hypothetical protein PHD76_11520 [Methylacidiphilales bacterium]|nr:hypothetical protein [Candidatus Methylacidiphilales bacterium]